MEDSPLYLMGHWPPRNDSPQEAANSIRTTLSEMSKLASNWGQWYDTSTNAKINNAFEPDTVDDVLNSLLESSQRIGRGKADPDLWLFFGADSASQEISIDNKSALAIKCCSKNDPRILNSITLQWPIKNDNMGDSSIESLDFQKIVARTIIKIWQPAWLSIRRRNDISFRPWSFGALCLGWINYICPSIADISSLPHNWHWEENNEVRLFCFDKGCVSLDNHIYQDDFQGMVNVIQNACDCPAFFKTT